MDTLKKFNLKVWRVMQVLELHLQEGDGGWTRRTKKDQEGVHE